MNPLISIVVPTYNRANLITRTIESLLNQTEKNYEIIIVDDGSTDNTEEVVTPFLSEKLQYFKKINAERAAARNFGTQKAKGDYINWFDSDDIACPNHIQTAIQLIIDSMQPEWIHLGYSIEIEGESIVKDFNLDYDQELKNGNLLSCNGVFVRRDIALSNPFNEDRDLSASEDYELWLRLASQYCLELSNTITSIIVQHDGRSVLMSNPVKLISRFEKFIQYTTENQSICNYLGDRIGYFKMKNYLLLAVDLAANNHKKQALKYIKLSASYSVRIIFEKSFYATLKHLVL
jgi:glycosyltransferase involved in cell wall biosynthesis